MQDCEGRGSKIGSIAKQNIAEVSARGLVRIGVGISPRSTTPLPSESGVATGKDARSSAVFGERHDLYTQHVAQRKKQVARAQEQVREARVVQADMEEKLTNGLRDSESFRAEASEHPRPCLEPSTTRQGMELDPNEESIRFKAQEADLQS